MPRYGRSPSSTACWPRTSPRPDWTIHEAIGCNECTGGYKGRAGIYQVMPMTEEISSIVLAGDGAAQIAEVAQRSGIRDLRQSALWKAKQGMTSLAEINRVTKD